MKYLSYGLAACLLLAIPSSLARADERLVDPAPPVASAVDADSCVAVPEMGDCAGGVCRRPVASAVTAAGRVPVRIVGRVADRIQRRPILRRLFSPRFRVGGCRR